MKRPNASREYFVEIAYPGGRRQTLGPYATKADANRARSWQLRGWRGDIARGLAVPRIRVVSRSGKASNPARHRVRRVSKTGWLKAKAVRIVKQRGRTVVQIKRSASRRKR